MDQFLEHRRRDLLNLWKSLGKKGWPVWQKNSDDKSADRESKYKGLKTLAGQLTPSPPCPNYKDFLLEAYKKHSTELASIEDRLNRLLLIILAVFGAGATAIQNAGFGPWASGGLVFMVVVFARFGWHYSLEMRQARAAVRYLLVRCEIDMGFYIPKDHNIPGANKQNLRLYTTDELDYPTKGKFLSGTYTATIAMTAIGLIFLICHACSFVPAKKVKLYRAAVCVGVLHASFCDRDLQHSNP